MMLVDSRKKYTVYSRSTAWNISTLSTVTCEGVLREKEMEKNSPNLVDLASHLCNKLNGP